MQARRSSPLHLPVLATSSQPSQLSPPSDVDPQARARFIHLLYAPTNFCNMGCQYCYLGQGTDEPNPQHSPLTTLQSTVDQLTAQQIIPYNLSLHGGEPTAIRRAHLEELFAYISQHYLRFGDRIRAAGHTVNPLHIKTNLLNFDRLEDLFTSYEVSISASVDLPLSLHGRYRTDKSGRSTRPRIEANLRRLAHYPHHAKISCVVTRAHFEAVDELMADIRYIHGELGLDMTRFNVMFGFDSQENQEKFGETTPGLEPLSQDQQVEFYQALHDEFIGTSLERGFRDHWFKEFTPEFCCSAVNCGDKFFLLQDNGDLYSCPRGQSSARFRYGNVFVEPVIDVFAQGSRTIERVENHLELHDDCTTCEFLPYCNVGCSFVRDQSQATKSYTCSLQKQLYLSDPGRYPAFEDDEIAAHLRQLKFRNNLKSFRASEYNPRAEYVMTDEIHDPDNALAQIIARDPQLEALYAEDLFALEIDGKRHLLASQVLRNDTELLVIEPSSKVELKFRADLLDLGCDDPVNNHLHIMLLRDTPVRYGDENRLKQQHIADYSVYHGHLETSAPPCKGGERSYDLTAFLQLQRAQFQADIRNNLFFTTRSLREYHYKKQQKNAFYHIQAINLPFQNAEFYWHDNDH